MNTPTQAVYMELQQAYDHLNAMLFDAKLPACLITLQREKHTYGYFSSKRFASIAGSTTDEIALNPAYFGVTPVLETLQTLAHEMCHLWQAHFGTPGRGRYHNAQWASKMESIGLMPSSTGQPGGAKTGDCMADYVIEGGLFIEACKQLVTNQFHLSWYDRFPPMPVVQAGARSAALQMPQDAGGGEPYLSDWVANTLAESAATSDGKHQNTTTTNKSNRVKYTCLCGTNIWGKPDLRVLCQQCDYSFVAV
jgi:predicted SprT family Zn-dependent metalloprotease